MKNVLVIGDSTSSSIGGNSENWLRRLESNSAWQEQIRFIDTSAPGVTAGAALFIFVKKLIALRFSIFMVILSVGNCDRIQRPYISNKTSFYKIFIALIKSFVNLRIRKKYDWIKLDLTEWHSFTPVQFRQSLINFEKCLRLIKHLSKIFRINLFVITPRSNILFPPAVAKNNSLFYDLINFGVSNNVEKNSNLPDLIDNKWLASSRSLINLTDSHHVDLEMFESYDKQKIMCSLNNLAVHSFHSQKLDSALSCLEQLATDPDSPSEFIFFNMAKIYMELEDSGKAAYYFEKSLVADTYSYRVDSKYSDSISKIFDKSDKVKTLNLHDTKFDNFFLDHCHLLPEGQELIMESVRKHILDFVPQGQSKIIIEFGPVNPEIANGDLRTFNEVFGIESPDKVEKSSFQARAHAINVVADHLDEILLKSKHIELIESAVFYAFTAPNLEINPNYIAHTLNKERNRIKILSNQLKFNLPTTDKFNLPPELILTWITEVLNNLHVEIESFIYTDKNCSHRMRTIMNWYFKESLYFGFNSSADMLYNRNDFRRWKEALCLAISLNINQGIFMNERISMYFTIIEQLEKLLSTTYRSLDFLKVSKAKLNELESSIDIGSRKIWESNFGK